MEKNHRSAPSTAGSQTVNLGIQIVPKSSDLDSYSLVDVAIREIQKSGINYLVTPFETVLEGTWEEVMPIAQRAHQAVLDAGAEEVLVYYRIHIKNKQSATIAEKIAKYPSDST